MAGPEQTVERLTSALNQGDLDAAVALYEENAVLVARPGQLARGRVQIRQALEGFVALHPTLSTTATQVTELGDLALYISRWSLRGTDPSGAPV
ncbi:MAG TPA: nuclear transport factor 2 family protein, partial [Vicinamibacterales bacterium]